jgi:hypothetical protein
MDITTLPIELQEQIASLLQLQTNLEQKHNIKIILKYVKWFESLYEKVEKRGSPRTNHSLSGCWTHTTSPSSSGYGQLWINNKMWNLHRLSWFLHNGCPEDLSHSFYTSHKFHIAHLCDNKECCSPEHLELQPCKQNIGDGVKKRDEDKPKKEIKRNAEPCKECVAHHKSCDGGIPCDRCKKLNIECVKKEYKTHLGSFVKGEHSGENNVKALLNWEQVKEIRRRKEAGLKYGELKKMAEEYGIAYTTIQAIVSGRIWKEDL